MAENKKISQLPVATGVNTNDYTVLVDGNNSTNKRATVAQIMAAAGGGTVTSVGLSGSQGVSVSGSPVTSSGTISVGLGAITPTSVAASGTVTGSNLSGTNTGDQTIQLLGDVEAGGGTGTLTTVIATGMVTNAKLANMTGSSLKGRASGVGAPQDLNMTQVAAMLPAVVGDSGSGGTAGLVPAPGAGSAAAKKFLRADATWVAPDLNDLTPTQSGNSGKALFTDGTTTSWQPVSGAGTVTSVNVIGGATGLSTTGGPITASGTIALTGTVNVAHGGTGATTAADARTNLGVTATGSDTTYAYRANNLSDLASASSARGNLGLGTVATKTAPSGTSSQLLANDGSGGFSNVTVGSGLSFSAGTLSSSSGGGTVTHTGGALTANSVVLGAGTNDSKVVAGIVTDGTSKITLGVSTSSVGAMAFNNLTSGTVTVQPVTGALGTVTLSLPAATDTLVGKATTDTLTNKTFDTAGAGNNLKVNGNLITGFTGSGATVALSTSPAFTTPSLGVATATSLNALTLNANATGFSVAGGTTSKTLTVNNTLGLSGTDSTTMTFPSTSATIARTDAAQTFAGIQTFSNTTQSTSSSTGAVKLSGGLGVAKNLYVGGGVSSSGNIGGNEVVAYQGFYTGNGYGLTLSNPGGAGLLLQHDNYANDPWTLNLSNNDVAATRTLSIYSDVTFDQNISTSSSVSFLSLSTSQAASFGGSNYTFGTLPLGATTVGTALTIPAATYTVTGTNTATAFQAVYHGAPTFTDSSAGTITDLFSEVWAGPAANAGSLLATRKHTLGILDSTSAASSITGAVVIANVFGTTATSVGIGGGNINAGGNGTFGGTLSVTGHATLATNNVGLIFTPVTGSGARITHGADDILNFRGGAAGHKWTNNADTTVFATLSNTGTFSMSGLKAAKITATSGFISAADEGANTYNVLASRNNADSAYLPLTIRSNGVTFDAAITPTQTGGIVGTTTNNNANAGSVGEYVESVITVASAVSLTSGTNANVTSISLTAGDWDVFGVVYFNAASTTQTTEYNCSISQTSATLGGRNTGDIWQWPGTNVAIAAGIGVTGTPPRIRISLSATTTIYLVAYASFTVSTMTANGAIRARRCR